MKIRMIINGEPVPARLDDNPSARDFFARLPLTLTFEDYASTEKIAYLEQPLDQQDAPAGYSASAGDITYYAPWGNLALFYKGFGYAKGLIRLGNLEERAELLATPGKLNIRIEAD
ncbi:cyclophilin-like fold protein [Marinobacterium sp. YM272]|uniref:cyclophilin-like fold protein n=1 Tax=Marinobacterium sp. YM272 TaxID=3421654 RepID=UPI003D7FD7DC